MGKMSGSYLQALVGHQALLIHLQPLDSLQVLHLKKPVGQVDQALANGLVDLEALRQHQHQRRLHAPSCLVSRMQVGEASAGSSKQLL